MVSGWLVQCVDPTTGEETQKIIAKLYQTPHEVVERAKKLLTPQ